MTALLDWRRRVNAIYAAVRDLPPQEGHALWTATRRDLYATHPESAGPLGPVAPYDPAWRAVVALSAAAPARIEVATGTDGVVAFERVGVLHTPWGPLDAWWLASYGGGLWVPVRDPSTRSYGGGRYLLDTVKGADLGSVGDDLVVDEDIEGIFLAEVFEEILLAPSFEHVKGDLDGGEVAARGEDGGLMSVVGAARDLAKGKLAAEEPHALIGEVIGDGLSFNVGLE